MKIFNPLDHPICFAQPLRLIPTSAWTEHVPFGMYIIDLLRPKIVIELGTHMGVSYCAFCQAVKQLGLDTRCYAVDTWGGDIQAGFYGPDVLADLRSHHDPLYGEFSRLVTGTFDDAVNEFPDESIDLLHIDGLHTYEAVKHDFGTWLPKLNEHAVVLFHDINVRERDFGVWKLWEELTTKYPAFSMTHGHGLGVLAVGKEYPQALNVLLGMKGSETVKFRELFYLLGRQLETQMSVQVLFAQVAEKEKCVQVLSTQLTGKEQYVQALLAQVAEKEQSVQVLSTKLTGKEQYVQALLAQVAEKEQSVQMIRSTVAEENQKVLKLTDQVHEKERVVQALTAKVGEKEDAITHYESILAEKENRINNLEIAVDSLYRSTSWKITRPIRAAKSFAQAIIKFVRLIIWRVGAWVYREIPAAPEKKLKLKDAIFHRFNFILAFQPDRMQPPINLNSTSIAKVEAEPYGNPDINKNKTPNYPLIRIVDRKKISVIITSYNHERYIKQSMDSILDQKGNFNLEIILGDDCSTDNTFRILQEYSEIYPNNIIMISRQDNMGITKNLKRCLEACTGDFIAICEGDDYWTDEYKLQKQMDYLEKNKTYSMCFSALMIYIEAENRFILHAGQNTLKKDFITTEDLIEANYIGNFSCCMYRFDTIKKLPPELFNIYTVDWMFNMACGEIGKIGFMKDPMSIYRLHSNGAWSGKTAKEQTEMLLQSIDTYNIFFKFKYQEQFMRLKNGIKDQKF